VQPFGIVAGNFDRAGHDDIATISSNGNGSVSVLINTWP
jgi:hypothetical protein